MISGMVNFYKGNVDDTCKKCEYIEPKEQQVTGIIQKLGWSLSPFLF